MSGKSAKGDKGRSPIGWTEGTVVVDSCVVVVPSSADGVQAATTSNTVRIATRFMTLSRSGRIVCPG